MIDLVETTYRLDLGDREWRQSVILAARPLLDRGLGAFLIPFDIRRESTFGPPTLAGADPWVNEMAQGGYWSMPRKLARTIYAEPETTVGSSSELYFGGKGADAYPPLAEVAARHGFRDFFGIRCSTSAGAGCIVGAFTRDLVRTTPGERDRWWRLRAHLVAALRLRDALANRQRPGGAAEAVFDASGRLIHAEGQAVDRRDALRRHVAAIERARSGRVRQKSDEALSMWRVLSDARWTLVDTFEQDGKRFVVARRNEPDTRDPRLLSPREAAVAELVARACPNKLVAYELGISEGSVASTIAAIRRKLGVTSRAELITRLSSRVEAVTTRVGEEELLIARGETRGRLERLEGLTAAEREVVLLALAGRSNAVIARERGSAVRTVTTLLASAYRRLGVQSRGELVRLLG